MWLGSVAFAAPPPIELVGLEGTPRLPVACELFVSDHDGERPFTFRLSVSAPDADGRAWIQRVVLDPRVVGIPPSSPVATVHEVHTFATFFDERIADGEGRHHVARVKPSWIDWSRWPFALAFVGPRVDDPPTLGAYTVTTDPEAEKVSWGSCILRLQGPGGVAACAIVGDAAGSSCLAAYAERHGLGPR